MRTDYRERARIMVVDDEPQNVRYVMDVLKWAGYRSVDGYTDPIEAVERFGTTSPDLVILDLLMPEMDGFEAMEAMRTSVPDGAYLPFLILTSDISSESRRRALSSGAKDFLTKPMSPTEVRLRVDNLLETRFLYLECARQADLLDVADRPPVPVETDASGGDVLDVLERWAAFVDTVTGHGAGRSKRVSWLSGRIAEAMDLPAEMVDRVRAAALLFALDPEGATGGGERPVGKRTEAGRAAAARLLEGSPIAELAAARRVVTSIDERYDGTGRPRGLRGDAIPIEARIVAVARAFDDVAHAGGAGRGDDGDGESFEAIEAGAGTAFDPEVVAALLQAQAVGA